MSWTYLVEDLLVCLGKLHFLAVRSPALLKFLRFGPVIEIAGDIDFLGGMVICTVPLSALCLIAHPTAALRPPLWQRDRKPRAGLRRFARCVALLCFALPGFSFGGLPTSEGVARHFVAASGVRVGYLLLA